MHCNAMTERLNDPEWQESLRWHFKVMGRTVNSQWTEWRRDTSFRCALMTSRERAETRAAPWFWRWGTRERSQRKKIDPNHISLSKATQGQVRNSKVNKSIPRNVFWQKFPRVTMTLQTTAAFAETFFGSGTCYKTLLCSTWQPIMNRVVVYRLSTWKSHSCHAIFDADGS